MSRLLVFVCSLFIYQLSAQPIAFDTIIDRHIKEQNLLGISVGIIHHGQIIYSKAKGLANIESNTPVHENTVYKIGSLSKQFIATAIIKLAAENKLSVHDPVHMYFPDAPSTWSGITIHHLLNHSSGLERESPAFDGMKSIGDEMLIKATYPDTLIFPTGTKWQYCNLGYFMLADIIRKVSDRPFISYMDRDIFKTYELASTRSTSLSDIVLHRSDGYIKGFGSTWLNAPNYVALRPSGAFLSTIPDLLQWELIIQKDQLLSHAQWESMWHPSIPTGETLTNGTKISYGYGWNVATYKNKRWVYHGGSLPGFRAIYYRYPDEKSAIIILCNVDHANLSKLAQDLAAVLLK